MLTTIADVLERAAGALRRVEASRRRARIAAEKGPIGFWRCVHSDELFAREFVVGRVYRAKRDHGTSTVRIEPESRSCWAPYWDRDERRFCYPAHQLDFEWMGASRPA